MADYLWQDAQLLRGESPSSEKSKTQLLRGWTHEQKYVSIYMIIENTTYEKPKTVSKTCFERPFHVLIQNLAVGRLLEVRVAGTCGEFVW